MLHMPPYMNRRIFPVGAAALLVLLTCWSCTKDFEELNTNPNAPLDVQPSLLLRQVIYSYADGMSYEGFTGGANLGQYFSAVDKFNAFDRGDLLAPQFGGNPWPILYTNFRDIELVLDKSRSNTFLEVYEGPALVMKTIIAGTLTDIFGDVPYSEAGHGREGEVRPSYDLQEDIYLAEGGLLDNLDQAVAAMDSYEGSVRLEGDVLYDGDLSKWIKLANSLRLKYLLRASSALDATQLAAIADIVADGRYIDASEGDAVFAFGAPPNDFRYARARLGDFTNYLMSATIDSTLDFLDDPREQLWFREASNGGYQGVRNGLAPSFTYDGGDISLPGRIWRENADQLKFPFMTAWETYFVLAEAVERGYMSGDVEAFYQQGIRHAFEYWDVELPVDYLSRASVALDVTANLEKIATQRWLASIGNGYEGWIMWRRTGFPSFLPPVASLNGGLIPVRFPYPTNEQALNQQNFRAALARIGGENSPNVEVWWDAQ